jgi:hypothetical protein
LVSVDSVRRPFSPNVWSSEPFSDSRAMNPFESAEFFSVPIAET